MDQQNKPSNYASDMPSPQQQPPIQAGFSDEYLASLQYNNEKFELPWYDTAGGYMLIAGVGVAVLIGGVFLCVIILALMGGS